MSNSATLRLQGLAASAMPSARFLRFLGGGVLNTVFGYAVFLVALKAGFSVAGGLVASTLTGILFNFQTSRRIVFQSRQTGLLLRFTAVYAMVFAINYAAMMGLKHCGLQNWSAQALLVVPMALLAYVAQRNLVFNASRTPS